MGKPEVEEAVAEHGDGGVGAVAQEGEGAEHGGLERPETARRDGQVAERGRHPVGNEEPDDAELDAESQEDDDQAQGVEGPVAEGQSAELERPGGAAEELVAEGLRLVPEPGDDPLGPDLRSAAGPASPQEGAPYPYRMPDRTRRTGRGRRWATRAATTAVMVRANRRSAPSVARRFSSRSRTR